MGGTRFMVQWEEHPSHLATRLGQLLEHQTLVDVTLMCNTHTLRVHRAVLAACSPYFETILQRQLGMYPLIVLKDMQFSVLKSLIEFMYCGETSVTEDNLSALLQAAKFFQVKGLSAMTKEALGLTSTTPKTTTVNGDSARKAFVGRSKRVGMQQTFVASGLKTLSSTTHAASSHVHGSGGDIHTPSTGKTIFQTTPKSVSVRQDTHRQQQQQQQTDTAQLLLSLSGSEFPKQAFHTVSKNVRFHHAVSSGGAVTVEPSRSCPLDSSVVKNKETAVRTEVIDRVPVVTPNGGVKPASVILPTQLAEKVAEQPAVPEKVGEGTKDDLPSQMFFVEDGPCKRGRPLKRQMNLVFQEKVLTDAELALQKEAEASRKALEMLQQEMSTGDETPASGITQAAECGLQKIAPAKQPIMKGQPQQTLNNILTTAPPRILPKEPTASTKLVSAKTNTVTQVTSVNTPETNSQNVIYQVAGNAVPAIDSSSNETNIVYQLQEDVIAGQDSSNGTNIVYQVADNTVVSEQDSNSQNIIYQVADNAGTSAEDSNNTNIIYQVADNSNAAPGSAMSQYMEALKEAGLPSDVPILLESSDGSYVTVNEEVLMNIMNGGMIQVGDGSIVGGEGVQFIVQEVQEVNEGQVETSVTSAEQSVDTEMNVADNVPVDEQMQATEANDNMVESESAVTETDTDLVELSTQKSLNEQTTKSVVKEEAEDLPAHEEREPMDLGEVATSENENTDAVAFSEDAVQHDVNELVMDENGAEIDSTPMETEDNVVVPQPVTEAPAHSDEIITGDGYGEEAMEGFAVMETNGTAQRARVNYTETVTTDLVFPEQTSSNEAEEDKSFPASETVIAADGEKVAETPSNGGMSVEQALQAMMGEGSDTEMEVCANTDADGTTTVKPIISHRDTKGRSTPNEGSIDEETEDLRLVLSPEDDSIKVEDESQSAGEGSLNDSFTLALSSPDSTGNEKAHLEAENSAEGSQQVEIKPVESETDTLAETIDQDGIAEMKYTSESTSTPKSDDSGAFDILPSEAASVGTSENSNPVEINESRAEEPVGINNSIPLQSNSDILSEVSDAAIEAKEISESKNISAGKSDGANETAKVRTSELNFVEDDEVSSNNPGHEVLPETDNPSNIGISSNVDNSVYTEVALVGTEATICNPLSNIDSDRNSAEHAVNVSARDIGEVGKSLPMLSPTDGKEISVGSGTSTASVGADVSETEPKNDTASILESVVPVAVQESAIENVLADEQGKEAELGQEATEIGLSSEKEIEAGRQNAMIIENQGNAGLTSPSRNTDENGIETCADGSDGTVTSPSKDIPYAVGLLPLKTALEKLQAMPDYHPRKTRSASSGKESGNEVPASRLKRKASSSTDSVEKKMKPSDVDEGDGSYDSEGIVVMAAEGFDETGEGSTELESCVAEDNMKTVLKSPLPEESGDAVAVGNKMEPLPSMMELVSDSSDAV